MSERTPEQARREAAARRAGEVRAKGNHTDPKKRAKGTRAFARKGK